MQPRFNDVPIVCWSTLSAIAVGGSCLYGSSLALVMKGWHCWSSALLLTLSAGLAWCIFGPILVMVTKKNAFTCAHASLVTMAYGEMVLAMGALLNILGVSESRFLFPDPASFNIAWVSLSNVTMATALSVQLAGVRVAPWKTLLTWILALNGSGFLFFIILKTVLEKGM